MEQNNFYTPNVNTIHKQPHHKKRYSLKKLDKPLKKRGSSYISFNNCKNPFVNKIKDDFNKVDKNIQASCYNFKKDFISKIPEEDRSENSKTKQNNKNNFYLRRNMERRKSAYNIYTPIFNINNKKSNNNYFLSNYSLISHVKNEHVLTLIPENRKDSESIKKEKERRKKQIKEIIYKRRKYSENKNEEEKLNKQSENKITNKSTKKSTKKDKTELKCDKNLKNNTENNEGNRLENINSRENGKIRETKGINIYNIKKDNKEKIKKRKNIKSCFLCCFSGQNDSSIENE